jgi:ubiquitin C-terminal hydrolase
MDYSKYYKKGYTGIDNLGNTCFLNSCLQVLNHTYELNHVLDKKVDEQLKPDLPDTNILKEWNDLREVMWSGNGVVSPNKFVHNVHKIAEIKKRDIFTGWAQNDMPEFLLFIIE